MHDMNDLSFRVFGVPIPKGSLKAFMRPGMRFPVVTHDNLKSRPWAKMVRLLAQARAPVGGPWEGAIVLHAAFSLPRPKRLPKRVIYPCKKPDLDKLVRNIMDAMTGVIYVDDAQVIDIWTSKHYATAAMPPQVRITIRRVLP